MPGVAGLPGWSGWHRFNSSTLPGWSVTGVTGTGSTLPLRLAGL